MAKRDSTIIYRSFYEAIKDLPKEDKANVWDAVFEYSLNFKLIPLTGVSKTVFTLMKPQLDANNRRYKNGAKPKQNRSEKQAKQKREASEIEANKNDNKNKNANVNENENENGNIDDKGKGGGKVYFTFKDSGPVFIKPSEWMQTGPGRGYFEQQMMKSRFTPEQVDDLLFKFDLDKMDLQFDNENNIKNSFKKFCEVRRAELDGKFKRDGKQESKFAANSEAHAIAEEWIRNGGLRQNP